MKPLATAALTLLLSVTSLAFARDALDSWFLVDPMPIGVSLYDVIFQDGRFVAVGAVGAVYTSIDGRNWSSGGSGSAADLRALTWGGGKFVAVGTHGTIMASLDGVDWIKCYSSITGTLTDVAYGDGTFVAVGHGGMVLTSTNGFNWTYRNPGVTGNLNAVCFGNGVFVAAGGSPRTGAYAIPNGLLSSPDGISWTAAAIPPTFNAEKVAFGNGAFIALSWHRALRSVDGLKWEDMGDAAFNINKWYELRSLEFANDRFIALIYCLWPWQPPHYRFRIYSSRDGSGWNEDYYLPEQEPVRASHGVAYGNGTFVVVGDRILTSIDGKTWIEQKPVFYRYPALYFANESFSVSQPGRLLKSVGPSWLAQPQPAGFQILWVVFGNGVYLARAYDEFSMPGLLSLVSSDGAGWTSASTWVNTVVFDGERFVGMTDSGLAISIDGRNWTPVETSGVLPPVSGLIYGNGMLIAAGLTGSPANWRLTVSTSRDAATWSSTVFPFYSGTGIAAGNGRLVVMHAYAREVDVHTSDDGVNWSAHLNRHFGFEVRGGSYGNGWFVLVGYHSPVGAVMTSPDGIRWTARAIHTDRPLSQIAFGNGRFVVTGDGAPVFQSALVDPPYEVVASVPSPMAAPSDPGAFTLTRRGNTAIGIGLTVSVSFGGTAQNGMDCEPISSSIIIPANQNSVTVPVQVRPSPSAWTKSLIVNVEPGEAYSVGSARSAVLSLENPGSAPRFRLSGVNRQPDGTIQLLIDAPAGAVLFVEVSSDLRQWLPLKTLITSADPTQVIDSSGLDLQHRFYRATVQAQ
jgi:hypothetical protein